MSMAEDLYLYFYSLSEEDGGGSISVSGKNKGARTVSGTDHVDWKEILSFISTNFQTAATHKHVNKEKL